jgi:tRNA(Arg) A34 adenosine deaminase TadA
MIDIFETPKWVEQIVTPQSAPLDRTALMRICCDLARENVRHGGGPFAALAMQNGRIVETGWNSVIPSSDSTAHAEIVCLRRLQRKLGSHDLSNQNGLELLCSCAPCIQCFGAIYWSGVKLVTSCGTKQDAEAVGFYEGPVSQSLWDQAKSEKAIVWEPSFERTPDNLRAFADFRRGGTLY